MTLLEILDQHKAHIAIPLSEGVGSEYSEYHASIGFAENKITVQIYNDEGWAYELNENDGMPYEWAEQVTKFVNDLKQIKAIPDYTLYLLPPKD